ncbi:hypothetical protein GRF29_106g133339 [Pseudopithomyces chartarum]|uniref:HORMA domain-containing protein n=1 Tax=Pseudopithomyces chartarum TaxID=1892770 RepID=A0AAN6LSA3_9PLEO|nr:hypothetical protein GRF29_106g133339 [Pseudopithomyces chartarum]
MPTSFNTTLTAFTHFLTAYIHSICYYRHLYPPDSFLRTRFHNTPAYQSLHPDVCQWILDAVSAVKDELNKGTIARLAIVLFHPGFSPAPYADPYGDSPSGEVKVLERYILDVSAFPALTREQRFMDIAYEKSEEDIRAERDAQAAADEALARELAAEEEALFLGKPVPKRKVQVPAAEDPVAVDLSEQFRAAFIMLATRTSQLEGLPRGCSFNVSMELREEADVDPPLGHPQRWMPSQPSLQRTGRRGAQLEDYGRREGADLGGARVTPIRTVEAGVLRFEAWIEEGRAKFETKWPEPSSVESEAYDW